MYNVAGVKGQFRSRVYMQLSLQQTKFLTNLKENNTQLRRISGLSKDIVNVGIFEISFDSVPIVMKTNFSGKVNVAGLQGGKKKKKRNDVLRNCHM